MYPRRSVQVLDVFSGNDGVVYMGKLCYMSGTCRSWTVLDGNGGGQHGQVSCYIMLCFVFIIRGFGIR